eukprot:COSAG05_NODE_4320_length_1568_cov_3.088496_1_plen_294_part_10
MADASEGADGGEEAWLASMEARAHAMLAGDGVAQRGGQQGGAAPGSPAAAAAASFAPLRPPLRRSPRRSPSKSPAADTVESPEQVRTGELPDFSAVPGYISGDEDDDAADEQLQPEAVLPANLRRAMELGENDVPEELVVEAGTTNASAAAADTTKTFNIKSLKVGVPTVFGTLRYFLAQRGLETHGRKAELIERLTEACNGAESFEAAVPESESNSIDVWVDLEGIPCAKEAQINRNGGAAPTNLDLRPEVPKQEFLMDSPIKRPKFAAKRGGKSENPQTAELCDRTHLLDKA